MRGAEVASTTYAKDPQATLDYVFDWSQWVQNGEVIVTSNFAVSNTSASGLTVSSTVNDASTATIWLGGGTIGRTYSVVNTVTTDQGRTNVKTLNVRVMDR